MIHTQMFVSQHLYLRVLEFIILYPPHFCVPGQDTLLLQFLSTPRCMNDLMLEGNFFTGIVHFISAGITVYPHCTKFFGLDEHMSCVCYMYLMSFTPVFEQENL